METLKNALVKELRCRTSLVAIPALVEDYGVEVLGALVELRREGKVRLVAIGGSLGDWLAENGWTENMVIRAGSGEVYTSCKLREE